MIPEELTGEASHARIREALAALDKRHLLLSVHAPSLPSLEEEDFGRGTPYSVGASRFFAFVERLGFSGVQLGPMGQTSEGNASPYDGTLFAQNLLDLWLPALVDGPMGGLLPERIAQMLITQAPPQARSRVDTPRVHAAMRAALEMAWTSFSRMRARGEAAHLPLDRIDAFAATHRGWLEPHALYEVLCREHGAGTWRLWRDAGGEPHPDQRLWAPNRGEEAQQEARRAALLAQSGEALGFHAFTQWVLAGQHAALRGFLERLGLKLFGDLQIGASEEDRWVWRDAFLPGYLMGAPPSRTNPEGQPWGYPVPDPEKWANADGNPGRAQEMLRLRMDRMLSAYDGVRIDHPHGWVSPWVYVDEALDPLQAVQAGARLYSSPELFGHPTLQRLALVGASQLAPAGTPRNADDWVRNLEPAQLDAYARSVDLMVETARRYGRNKDDLAFEVLSTQPYPLEQVLARHGLGRFRVTQKADPFREEDVYRSEHAAPEDWMMVSTHDTPPFAKVLADWARDPGLLEAHARYRASNIEPDPSRRARLGQRLAQDPRRLWEASFAELFSSRARQVSIFFTDLYGMDETYNVPGTVSPDNWSLRIPQPAEASYAKALSEGRGVNLPRVLALALRARGGEFARAHRELADALDAQARALEPSIPQED